MKHVHCFFVKKNAVVFIKHDRAFSVTRKTCACLYIDDKTLFLLIADLKHLISAHTQIIYFSVLVFCLYSFRR